MTSIYDLTFANLKKKKKNVKVKKKKKGTCLCYNMNVEYDPLPSYRFLSV